MDFSYFILQMEILRLNIKNWSHRFTSRARNWILLVNTHPYIRTRLPLALKVLTEIFCLLWNSEYYHWAKGLTYTSHVKHKT